MADAQGATLVLVHGAGAGSWMWVPVGAELDERGIDHVEVDLPSVGEDVDPAINSHDDAAHVRAVLDTIDGPVVLCGNSYGGVVITEASAGHPRVVRLVYIAAYMPDVDDDLTTFLTSNCTPESLTGATLRPDGLVDLDKELTKKLAFHQAPPDVADRAAARIRPMALGGGSPTVHEAGWRTIPSTYIVCSEDRSIQPEAQRRWARERATDSIEVAFDHCPQLSHPVDIGRLLADVIVTSASTPSP